MKHVFFSYWSRWLLCAGCCLLCAGATDIIAMTTIPIKDGWRFRKIGTGKLSMHWFAATVPGTIHTDLLRHGIIPDPFEGVNESRVQWVERESWEYETTTMCSAALLANDAVELVFEGLDTYAHVYINNVSVLQANNMFRTWRIDSKRYLKIGNNTIRVVFDPATTRGAALTKQIPFTLGGDDSTGKVWSRKAQYHYGWDWGPRFITCGIWRSVHLEAWSGVHLESVHVVQQSLTDKEARLSVIAEIRAARPMTTTVHVSERCRLRQPAGINLFGVELNKQRVTLQKGSNRVVIKCSLNNPQRWWCNGLGKPHLYSIHCDIVENGVGKRVLDSATTRIGLRTLEIVQEKDQKKDTAPNSASKPAGQSFMVRLNGVPVFMKGANYIPPDSFLPRVTTEDYRRLVSDAAMANMNMLRVWGGGTYERDEFYDLCDEQGILVWQDFMFACAMVPGDSAFVENVRQEAIDNVKRLRNHPCIALWCGNNEIDEAWHNWGWQKQYGYSSADSARIWSWYERIFHDVLPAAVAEHDPQRFYWRSSPQHGWGRAESMLEGDSHYWGVWWGLEPFERYEEKVGRFMSEYGMQACPPMLTIKTFAMPNSAPNSAPNSLSIEELSISSATMKAHQKHPTGYASIQAYLERDYKPAKNFEQYVYVTQLLQAKGITTAIEAHRRAKPYCMGTLYWQLNDCWQVTSWSSRDYFGRWKALHYAVRDLFADVALSAHRHRAGDGKDSLELYLVSDRLTDVSGMLELRLLSFDGTQLWSSSLPVVARANASSVVFTTPEAALLGVADRSRTVLVAEFKSGAGNNASTLAKRLVYFTQPKDAALSKPQISVKISGESGRTVIELQSNTLAKNVYLSLREGEVHFSDNFFDLLPGEIRRVTVMPVGAHALRQNADIEPDALRQLLLLQSLIDSY